jgi:hypothetical protein
MDHVRSELLANCNTSNGAEKLGAFEEWIGKTG